MSTHAAWRLTELASGYWQAATIGAAVSLGVFESLAEPRTAAAVAAACDTDFAYTADLLEALAALELLERSDDRYVVAADYRTLLAPSGGGGMLDALRLNNDLYGLWGRLGDCVRDGKPAIPPQAHLGADPAQTRRFTLGMHSRALALGPAIADAVDLEGCANLLDVGSGPGTIGRLVAARYPDLRITQFDLPGVTDVARELTESDPAAPRISLEAGDYRNDPLPGGFDAILYCGALHQESPDTAAALFDKLHASLNPGGRLCVVDFFTGHEGDAFAALFSLQMKLFNPTAGVFSIDDVKAMLERAGFAGAAARRLQPTAYTIVEARRA